MENNAVIVWQSNEAPLLPKKINKISTLVDYAIQLSQKDQRQIIKSFNDGSYEMVSTYIWTKSITSLKHQLSKMGVQFIAEMLDRPDINDYTNIQQAISEYDAIRLAEELGIINGTVSFRLKQAMEIVAHFNQPELEDNEENELTEDETKMIMRSCIQGILGYDKIDAAIDFKNFRQDLEDSTLLEDNPYIIKLVQSPYFFHRTTLRMLLALVKTSNGAQLENSLANSNMIIPKIWNNLKHPEKYQVGRSYSELFADGKNKASSGLRQVLLKVKGFDFVPEDLRSTSFIKAANDVLNAHSGLNNYYNEPAPVNTLSRMGSVIPTPAFAICMTAILSVKLGNAYGISNAAQDNVNTMIKAITRERWIYFFKECISSDERILFKLTQSNPRARWLTIFTDSLIDEILQEIKSKDINNLLRFTKEKKSDRIKKIASDMYQNLGYE